MTTLQKTCFCKKEKVKFRSDANWDESIFARVFCSRCVDRAPLEALLVRIESPYGKPMLYGFDFNQGILKELDKDFRDEEIYYQKLFEDKKIDLVVSLKKFELWFWGLKSRYLNQEYMSGSGWLMARKNGAPAKLPKKIRSGPEESYVPFSGYKGHH